MFIKIESLVCLLNLLFKRSNLPKKWGALQGFAGTGSATNADKKSAGGDEYISPKTA